MEAKDPVKNNLGNFSILPIEIISEIFSHLNEPNQRKVRLLSNVFKEIIHDETKCMEKIAIKITDENVQEMRDGLEKQIIDTCFFKYLQIMNVKSSQEDLNFITKGIAKEVEHLVIDNKKAFNILKCNLKNLKSLELHDEWYDNSFRFKHLDLWDESSYNLSELPLLEDLILKVGKDSTNGFLMNLEQNPISLLKRLELKADFDNQHLINVLNLHTTIEDLNINIKELPINNADYLIYIPLWEEVFANLTNLRYLSVNHDKDFVNIVLESLPTDTQLEKLEVDGAKSDTLFSLITNKWQNSLQSLSLNFCTLNDVDLMELNKLIKLRVLKIRNSVRSDISRGLLQGIAAKPTFQLAELHLNMKGYFDERELNEILSRLSDLRVLVLDDTEKSVITNNTLASIFQCQTDLRVLKIHNSSIITDEGFTGFGNNPYPIGRLQKLKELDLVFCRELTDQMLTALKCSQLRKLTLKYIERITSEGLKQLVKNCPLLENLGVSKENIPDPNELKFIGDELKLLRKINIDYFGKYPKNEIKEYLKYLREGVLLCIS